MPIIPKPPIVGAVYSLDLMAANRQERMDRGLGPDAVIKAAKAKAKRALRQKNPCLTTLEKSFYLRLLELRAIEAEKLIQLKPRRKSIQMAA